MKGNEAARYRGIVEDLSRLLARSRAASVRAVNSILTLTCWRVGRRIVEFELSGASRAEYGDELLKKLADDLTKTMGRGFGWRSLYDMRRFYETYAGELSEGREAAEVRALAPRRKGKQLAGEILQTLSAKSVEVAVARRFQLPWSHYARLLRVTDADARRFYEQEALRGGWSLRQLDRQIGTAFYERSSSGRSAQSGSGGARQGRRTSASIEAELRNPYVLEFLGLKDEYSENELEDALISNLQQFLVELGGDFAFVGRQLRLRIGHAWYRVDLLFFHRVLRCLVVIDLKVGTFTHADAGQMHLYLNYAREHWTRPGENAPIGLVLCSEADTAVAHYALQGLPNKILAAKYRMKLPSPRELERWLRRARSSTGNAPGAPPARQQDGEPRLALPART